MDRIIVYPGSIPLDTDLQSTNRNTMIALSALIQTTFGAVPIFDGLAVTPTSPPSLVVQVGPGCITEPTAMDSAPYSTLGSDSTESCLKIGINIAPAFLTLAAPTRPGTSITYLIESSFQDGDVNPDLLPYYIAENPAQVLLGPIGAVLAQPTLRTQRVALQAKAGAAAPTGTQTAPAADAGWLGVATVTVAAGATAIRAGAILTLPGSSQALVKLPYLRPGFSAVAAFTESGMWTVPVGVTRAKITVIGGGGAGGSHQTLPSGGGGAGGRATSFVAFLVAGEQVPIIVGAGGVPLLAGIFGTGGPGGTSSFGTIVSATGGQGGGGGVVLANCSGGAGGIGVGGDINDGAAWGSDSTAVAGRGGDGAGPGGGRGTSGNVVGVGAPGWGGGGGGGGASAPSGGTGAAGGAGGPATVIVEF